MGLVFKNAKIIILYCHYGLVMCECDLGGKNIIGYESMMQLI